MDVIEHLIILMMENRSFDHFLGSLTLDEGRMDVDGLQPGMAVPDMQGNPVPIWNMDSNITEYSDPPHDWGSQHLNFDVNCDPDAYVYSPPALPNQGFVQQYEKYYPTGKHGLLFPIPAPADIPMGYYTRKTLPVLYALADNFCVCDRWFCSLLSSTWPNRKYLLSGYRDADNDTGPIPPLPPGFQTLPFVHVLEDTVDQRTGNNYTWKCYFSDFPFLGMWYSFAADHALSNFADITDFVQDCQANKLPTVSIIDPAFGVADDHPSHDIRLGQKFIGLIVDALTNSESWKSSALVILYDENGGFFDHVAPPPNFNAQNGLPPGPDNPLGFRVPAIVISPYAKRGQTAKRNGQKTVFDHTSVMKSISVRWGIDFPEQPFGTRWQNAPDIWESCFDFTQTPLCSNTFTQKKGTGSSYPSFADLHWGSTIENLLKHPISTIEGLLDRAFLQHELKSLDHRPQVFDNLSSLENQVIMLKRQNDQKRAARANLAQSGNSMAMPSEECEDA